MTWRCKFTLSQLCCPGDCYIAAAGILGEMDGFSVIKEGHDVVESARRVLAFAKAILEMSKQVSSSLSCCHYMPMIV
jgi:hypothetical protein